MLANSAECSMYYLQKRTSLPQINVTDERFFKWCDMKKEEPCVIDFYCECELLIFSAARLLEMQFSLVGDDVSPFIECTQQHVAHLFCSVFEREAFQFTCLRSDSDDIRLKTILNCQKSREN